ncbi:MAG: EAL domain-containing protein [Erysipelotrichaceae bacterium]|nr:EAL domain-containing protein [Erysipelotrichaceae bacterium]
MTNLTLLSFDNYTFTGDLAVIAICFVMVILLMTSFVSRTRSFSIFINIIVLLVASALANIIYHILLVNSSPGEYTGVYIMRIVYHALMFDTFFLYSLYVPVATGMDHAKARKIAIASSILFFILVGADIIETISGYGFRISQDGTVVNKSNLFMIGYCLYIAFLLIAMNQVKGLLYKQILTGFFATMAISVLIRFSQLIFNQSSLTTMTFVLPAIAMMYYMHSNPYNITLGSVDVRSMEDAIRDMYNHKSPFVFLSLFLPEYDEEGKDLPDEIKATIRDFSTKYFRKCVLFQIGNGHVILIAPKKHNPDYEQRISDILDGFNKEYKRFHVAYKIVIGEDIDEISQKNEYVSLIRSIHNSMLENTVHMVDDSDVLRFNKNEYILKELTDIYNKKDVNDPRVLVFCQPVFNIQSGQFDTAEALMRLKLEETGLVFPDQFIPLAENYGYIHVLTEIILHKSCQEISQLIKEGFNINRISVNVSVLELKDKGFCDDINQIISNNSISGEKIAIELTESRSEADFMIMKEKIEELRRQGVRFYLDDFGTGYSNMERIMELPFDIIKFDRSMVLASKTDQRSEKIVENLAHMFKDMEYSILYEGVEDDVDEKRCKEMSASYLQGFKYSRPVPIEQLREFLPKA